MHGADAVSAFFTNIGSAHWTPDARMSFVPHWFNVVPGMLLYENGKLATALSVSIADGRIQGIYAVRNPDKLAAFPPL